MPPTLVVGMFSRGTATWPRKRGHGTRDAHVKCALLVIASGSENLLDRLSPGRRLRHNRIPQHAQALDLHLDPITGLEKTGGFRANPTPDGVPVKIRSPGLSVHTPEA